MILKGLAGEKLPVYGDGSNVRDWLHVDDHARALALVVERGAPGETYLIGSDAEETNLSVVETICDLPDRHAPPSAGQSRREPIPFVAARPAHCFPSPLGASK